METTVTNRKGAVPNKKLHLPVASGSFLANVRVLCFDTFDPLARLADILPTCYMGPPCVRNLNLMNIIGPSGGMVDAGD